jgi:hypothetical protein
MPMPQELAQDQVSSQDWKNGMLFGESHSKEGCANDPKGFRDRMWQAVGESPWAVKRPLLNRD